MFLVIWWRQIKINYASETWGVAGAGKTIIQNYASETWGGGQCQRPGEALGGGGLQHECGEWSLIQRNGNGLEIAKEVIMLNCVHQVRKKRNQFASRAHSFKVSHWHLYSKHHSLYPNPFQSISKENLLEALKQGQGGTPGRRRVNRKMIYSFPTGSKSEISKSINQKQ